MFMTFSWIFDPFPCEEPVFFDGKGWATARFRMDFAKISMPRAPHAEWMLPDAKVPVQHFRVAMITLEELLAGVEVDILKAWSL